MNQLTKICKRCQLEKAATIEFWYKKERGKYNLDSMCKPCRNFLAQNYNKRYRENNREMVRKSAKKHYHENREKMLKQAKEKYQQKKEWYKEYYQKKKKEKAERLH